MVECGINDPKLIEHLYWNECLCQREIAERLGVSKSLVGQRMQRFGIPRRSQAQATHLATGNHVTLSNEAIAFIDGCLLGDGTLVMNKSISACYQHTDKHRPYLVWLRSRLRAFEIDSSPIASITKTYRSKTYLVYRLSSMSYPELRPLRLRWYPDGEKRPPSDLDLTPATMRQWFLGDGSYRERSKERELRLCNTSFPLDAKELLKRKMNDIGIDVTIGKHTLRVRNHSISRFYQFIGPCPVPDIYGYKWPS